VTQSAFKCANLGHAVAQLVEALRHKPESPGFDSQWCHCNFFISNFRRVLNVVCFLLGSSPVSEFYMPTFRNTLFNLHKQVGMKYTSYLPAYEDGKDRVFRNVGI